MLTPPTINKNIPSFIGCEPITSFKKLSSQNMSLLVVKSILLLLLVVYLLTITNLLIEKGEKTHDKEN